MDRRIKSGDDAVRVASPMPVRTCPHLQRRPTPFAGWFHRTTSRGSAR